MRPPSSGRGRCPAPSTRRSRRPPIGTTRYLFALPQFKDNSPYKKDLLPPVDTTLTLRGVSKPAAVTLLADGAPLAHTFSGGVLSIGLPASRRTRLPDVVRVDLAAGPSRGRFTSLFDGRTLNGWSGNPGFWSVVDGAIHGTTEKTPGELILTDGEYGSFRLMVKSRLVSESNHLGVCFWGDRRPDWRYGDCILVIPPNNGMWDYHQGKGSPVRANLPHEMFDPHVWHETEILANLPAGTIRVAVNGVEVTRYRDQEPSRLKRGPIGLQIHSGASTVEYKDVRVEVDPQDDRLITVK